MLRVLLACAAVTAATVVGTFGTASAATSNPAWSVRPTQNFANTCIGTSHSAAGCDRVAIRSIDRGRAEEGLPAIAIPSSYYSLSTTAQLMFIVNKERAVRHLPDLPTSASLDSMAQKGAEQGTDPTGPANYAWGSNIAWGYRTPLAADFGWLYDDGPGKWGTNVDCMGSNHTACWGHRDNILAAWSGAQGAGADEVHGMLQVTQLAVEHY